MKKRDLRVILACLLLLCWPRLSSAYDFFENGSSQPHGWTTLPVELLVDGGPTDVTADIDFAVAEWNGVPTAVELLESSPAEDGDGNPLDFTLANFASAWGVMTGDGLHEVVVDEDGSIIEDLTGRSAASINGFAPTMKVTEGGVARITDTYLVLNASRSNFDRRSTSVHEIGHSLGLAHSSVGMHHSGSFPAGALDVVSVSDLPTMHPYSIGNTTFRRTLEADDRAGISELYPDTGFSALGTIEGHVTRCGSETAEGVTGVNVRAVQATDGSIQVGRLTGFDGGDDGFYRISGLPDGEYRVVVEPLVRGRFPGSLAIENGPVERNFRTEYHSAAECPEEIPDEAMEVSVAGGVATADVEVGDVRFALVVDDTGSMSEEIGGVRVALQAFIDFVDGIPFIDFPPTALVTFKDDVSVRLVTDDPDRLRTAVAGLTATGGADCPESSNAALLTAGRMLAPLGVSILFTDADSRADGPSRERVVDLYRSRGLLLSTLLTGSCTPASALAPGYTPSFLPSQQSGVARAGGRFGMDDGGIACGPASGLLAASTLPPDETLGPESGIVTFSTLTAATGGMFSFFEAVDAAYSHVIRNVATASVVPAVGLVAPREVAVGTVVDLEIRGGNTNFASGRTSLSLGHPGLQVVGLRVDSPTRITATLRVDDGAALGFHDVTVTTDLGGGGTEEAVGVGALEVVAGTTGPRIHSVVPTVADLGSSVTAVVSTSGLDLDSGAPTVSFGPGVTVGATRLLGSGRIEADLAIDPGASPGQRTVSVTSGGDTAARPAAFLVVEAVLGVPVITDVAPASGAQGETLMLTIAGLDTSFEAGTTGVTFSGDGIAVGPLTVMSPGLLGVEITIAPDAPPGFRDVQVTTGDEIAAGLDAFEVTARELGPLDIPSLSGVGLLVLIGALAALAVRRL